jgi:threo-3-hydroxy-L-aspartate ammonia-lyase
MQPVAPLTSSDLDLPTFADVQAAATRLAGVAHRTPVVTSRTMDERTGAAVFFKCENLQRAGAFKFRGAYNALSQLPPEARTRGVLTFSSGNHAGALALAGRLLGVPITGIMPQAAPRVKAEATRGYGAEIVFYDPARDDREALGARLASERGLHVIPPYDHPDIIAGQGTAALELFDEAGPLDLLLVPTGGGGLLAGCALAAQALAPGCRVVGVEPEAGDDGRRSLQSGTIQTVHNPQTIADGARTPSLGQHNWAIIRERVADIVTVDDDALLDALRFVWQRLKLVVEPTGCLAAAALLHGKVEARGLRVGVVFSGGNADLGVVC